METNAIKFVPIDFSVDFESGPVPLRGLLSELGITKVIASEALPPAWKNIFGKVTMVNLGRVSVPGLVQQQFDAAGTSNLIRFMNLNAEQKKYILSMIESSGAPPGWQRKFPRIDVRGQDPNLPLPSLCTIHFAGIETYAEVINFSIGGLRIETTGSQLASARVGMFFQLDLVTTRDEQISNLTTQIMNSSFHEVEETNKSRLEIRAFGLKITEISPENKKIYAGLIRDFCLVIKKQGK